MHYSKLFTVGLMTFICTITTIKATGNADIQAPANKLAVRADSAQVHEARLARKFALGARGGDQTVTVTVTTIPAFCTTNIPVPSVLTTVSGTPTVVPAPAAQAAAFSGVSAMLSQVSIALSPVSAAATVASAIIPPASANATITTAVGTAPTVGPSAASSSTSPSSSISAGPTSPSVAPSATQASSGTVPEGKSLDGFFLASMLGLVGFAAFMI